jgi:UDP-2,4-diacetamido-2,4,6-trideoxy-beta-L-altropyranose hydrolase
MKVVFRVDASVCIGIGHVMRCLTIADALNAEGVQCLFICREHTGNLIDVIENRGHRVCRLPMRQSRVEIDHESKDSSRLIYTDWLECPWQVDAEETLNSVRSEAVSWLIVDHYALDERWEKHLRSHCQNIMVIDDLADRRHDCDLLLDQTYGCTISSYQHLVPETCKVLTGSKYALLRPDFVDLREYSLQRRIKPKLENILITMGGMDSNNISGSVLHFLEKCSWLKDCLVTVVMGANAPYLEDVKKIAQNMSLKVDVKVNVTDMAKIMADSDIAIGAAGSTAWERCCLGLPTLMCVLAENQRMIAHALSTVGAVLVFKKVEELEHLMLLSMADLRSMSFSASRVTDGRGIKQIVNLLQGR